MVEGGRWRDGKWRVKGWKVEDGKWRVEAEGMVVEGGEWRDGKGGHILYRDDLL